MYVMQKEFMNLKERKGVWEGLEREKWKQKWYNYGKISKNKNSYGIYFKEPTWNLTSLEVSLFFLWRIINIVTYNWTM